MKTRTIIAILIAASALSLGQEPLDDMTPPTPAPITFPAAAPVCGKTVNAAKASNFFGVALSPLLYRPSAMNGLAVSTILDASNRLDGATITLRATLTRAQFLSLWDGVTNQFSMIGSAAGKTVAAISYAETNAGGAGSIQIRFRK